MVYLFDVNLMIRVLMMTMIEFRVLLSIWRYIFRIFSCEFDLIFMRDGLDVGIIVRIFLFLLDSKIVKENNIIS